MSPGKNCPIVTDYVRDKENLFMPDTMDPTLTLTEKLTRYKDRIVRVKPIYWFSKLFTEAQRKRYSALEKEFLCLIHSLLYFRDYIEATPQTYVLTDNMPVLWTAAHRTDQLKLTRHLLKLYELNINLVFTHIVGGKNSIADYLSRMFIVEEREEKMTTGKTIRVKEAHHILPNLPLMTPITVNDVLELFDESMVQKCYDGVIVQQTLMHSYIEGWDLMITPPPLFAWKEIRLKHLR
jgi:hypothetical protein